MPHSTLGRDTWLVFLRSLQPTLRSPSMLVSGVLQPVLYLVLFGPLLDSIPMPGAPAGDAWRVFVPGVLVMLVMFTGGFAGFALIPDQRAGVAERMRVSPLHRFSLLAGRVLRDAVVVLAQSVLLVALAVVAFGLRVPVFGLLGGLVLLALLTVTLASVSYALASRITNEYVFAPVIQSLSMPLLLLAGFLIPMNVGPGWLWALSRINPITYVMDAERALFLGQSLAPTVLLGSLVAVVIAGAGLVWGARSLR